MIERTKLQEELKTSAEKGKSMPFSSENSLWNLLQMPSLCSDGWGMFENHRNHCVTWSNGSFFPPCLTVKMATGKEAADSQGAKWGRAGSRGVKGKPSVVFQFISNMYFFRAKGPAVPH